MALRRLYLLILGKHGESLEGMCLVSSSGHRYKKTSSPLRNLLGVCLDAIACNGGQGHAKGYH